MISHLWFFIQKHAKVVESKVPLLEEARQECQEMCNAIKESSTKFDLKNRLANVERQFGDLQKKLSQYNFTAFRVLYEQKWFPTLGQN